MNHSVFYSGMQRATHFRCRDWHTTATVTERRGSSIDSDIKGSSDEDFVVDGEGRRSLQVDLDVGEALLGGLPEGIDSVVLPLTMRVKESTPRSSTRSSAPLPRVTNDHEESSF